jgi:hypothetical protein
MAGHVCALCGETTMDTNLCYLCPTRQALGANPSAARWAAVQCWACATCYDRGREIRQNQQLVAGWAVASVAGALLATLGVAVLGASWLLYPVVATLLALSLAGCLFYLRYSPPRQTRAWLARLDPTFRSALRVPEWSYFVTVRVTRTLPVGVTAAELDELMPPASPVPVPSRYSEPAAPAAAGHPA